MLNLFIQIQSKPFFWPVGRFWELLSGSVLAWIYIYKSEFFERNLSLLDRIIFNIIYSDDRKQNGFYAVNLISFLGVILLFFSVTKINESFSFPGKWAFFPILGTLLVIIAGPKAWFNRIILSNRVIVWFGLISYPLYLWHWPILSFLRIINNDTPHRDARIGAIIFSILLAFITYQLIEKPIRYWMSKGFRVLMLLFTACIIGFGGLSIYLADGFPSRTASILYENNKNELVRTTFVDTNCGSFISINRRFNYCRVNDIGAEETVAIIGDSHAHVSYPGIANGLESYGFNTLLAANSSCPPFLDHPLGENEDEKSYCTIRLNQILNMIAERSDVKLVLFFSRGPAYWTHSEPSNTKGKNDFNETDNTEEIKYYFSGLQKTIDFLNENGKKVIYVTENPELFFDSKSCMPRPFNNNNSSKCEQDINNVLERQKTYLNMLNTIDGMVVLNSLSAFCDDDICYAVDDVGRMLYADDDHLSIFGSYLQYSEIIEPYFLSEGIIRK